MIKITDALTAEHATLRTLFSKIEQQLPSLKTPIELRVLTQLVEQLLHRHDEDEEQLFFSALHHTTKHITEVEALSKAHGKLDAQLIELGNSKDFNKDKQTFTKTLHAIRLQFNHEELEIFPRLKNNLNKNSLKALGGAWLNQRSHL
jgi:hemerythrin-like domain-containing protein